MMMFMVCNSEVRIEHSLHKNEEEFRVSRRNTVQQGLQNLGIHCSVVKYIILHISAWLSS